MIDFLENCTGNRSPLAVCCLFVVLLIYSMNFLLGCGGGGSEGDGGGGGSSAGSGGVILLGWDSNTEEDLAGYRIHYGTRPRAYEQSIDIGMGTREGNLTIYSLTGLIPGQIYCFAVTAYDTANNESDLSEEVCGEVG
jgi:hypothetical protein